MDSLNLEVIRTCKDWLATSHRVFFVTVLNTWGASPRPPGSLFAFNVDTQKQVGSLSGGCIEEDLVVFLLTLSSKKQSFEPGYLIKGYGGSLEDSKRFLLPCGGTMSLLIEPMSDIEPISGVNFYRHLETIERALNAYKPIARIVNLSEKNYSFHLDESSLIRQAPVIEFNEGVQVQHRLTPMYRLLLIGAGDVTHYLSMLAKPVDFHVSICEPRQDYLQRLESFVDQNAILRCLPDDLIQTNFSDEYTAILCLAHDPKVDDMALLEALMNSESFYIGAMGSLNTSNNRKQRLQSLGLSHQQLDRLHAPIGVNIHSKTPQEIAIAILADLISARHRHKDAKRSKLNTTTANQ